MGKDILLYGGISSYQLIFFFDQIKEAMAEDPNTAMLLRINCEGGSPDLTNSIIAKLQELENMEMLVEGMAHSSALFFLCYAKRDVSSLDTSQFVLHRAAYPQYMEENPEFAASMYAQSLAKTNKDLEKAFRNTVDIEALENLPQFKNANLKVKDIFSMDKRTEVLLTASDMKKIGLVKKIIQVTPAKTAEIDKAFAEFKKCDSVDMFRKAAEATQPTKEQPQKIDIMDLQELKTKYPAIYSQAKAEGITEGVSQGVAQEKDRVEGIMAFADVDMAACKTAIASEKPLSAKQINEMTIKIASAAAVKKVESENAADVTTETTKVDALKPDAQKLANFDKGVDAILGRKSA